MTGSEEPVTIGRVLAPHGIRGELKVEPLTDFPERFERGSRFWLAGIERTVERGRWQARSVILKLAGIDNRDDAEKLRDEALTVPAIANLTDEGAYYIHDIIGLRVEDSGGDTLGVVKEVLTTGANDVYVVHGDRGELLLPALDDVVTKIDVAGGTMSVDVPEGLEFQARGPKPRRRILGNR